MIPVLDIKEKMVLSPTLEMNGLPGLKVQTAKVGSTFCHSFGLEKWDIK